ncbi:MULTISPECIES: bifunctional 2-polyprenyl-6-hydroxyphenol methylase/3-demethylubiquinol 3-O-methyltransferase UbiG [unclassified Oceanobacter]|uniref:class I SAM-dependent methyltransferase n=2 Tax=Gammaproteobacteria TaxID=1236 RepID=UPI002734038A|nr:MULTISPECIES: class I SAM-dependent methyltransferase [unclassified Oceanobacter]MDP2549106.1 class I SAM-dependent methyltransferase [Oceanobacter sp. 4_MG-2023]MDP2609468.1 class I SAM-dependent methyltransferase [Oceanobacter sp. 1_MG-2023]MDP2612832.1 class I SAM-dependent methyltransferase [Oceanobacter sp. 2_MG-2023]
MWDQRYNEEGFAYGTVANDFLQAQYGQILAGGKVLCLAEGEGRNAVFLAKQGYVVTAVDQSSVGLNKAQQLAADNGVVISTVVANLADFDLGTEAWDGIVSIAAHVPSALRKQLHGNVQPALKPGGVFILEAYTERHLEMEGAGGPPPSQKDMFMSLEALEAELQGLDFAVAAEVERHMVEGKYHRGDSAVVQIVACKTAKD